jgi:S-adenosylmethionine:diacylglycerol 3-amino-3-carboxypropyl transferase
LGEKGLEMVAAAPSFISWSRSRCRAVELRHHPVEHHQVGLEAVHRVDRHGRVADDVHRHLAQALERHAHDALDVLVVLDVADAVQRPVWHRSIFTTKGPGFPQVAANLNET